MTDAAEGAGAAFSEFVARSPVTLLQLTHDGEKTPFTWVSNSIGTVTP
jgi:hypothetical protein